MTKHLTWTVALIAVVTFGIATPAWAHHSHAMFDFNKETTISGTVSQFVFRNPHVYLYIDVKDDKGDSARYTIEMSNLTNTIDRGIGQTTFKPGDAVTIKVNPMKDGSTGGLFVGAKLTDGKTLGNW